MKLTEIQPHIFEAKSTAASELDSLPLEDQLSYLERRRRYLNDVGMEARDELRTLRFVKHQIIDNYHPKFIKDPSKFNTLLVTNAVSYAIDKSTPNGMTILQKAADAYHLGRDADNKLAVCRKQILNVKHKIQKQKIEKDEATRTQKTAQGGLYIPPIIYIGKNTSIPNPYFYSTPNIDYDKKYKYAGSADGYIFAGSRNNDYLNISQVLKRHGLTFATIYAGPNTEEKFLETIATTSPKNEVVWVRARHTNFLYIYGRPIHVPRFLKRDKAHQDSKFPKKKP